MLSSVYLLNAFQLECIMIDLLLQALIAGRPAEGISSVVYVVRTYLVLVTSAVLMVYLHACKATRRAISDVISFIVLTLLVGSAE